MSDPFSLWWLLVPAAAIFLAGVSVGALAAWAAARAADDEASNVITLPPLATRCGPTHVVTRARLYDFDREPVA